LLCATCFVAETYETVLWAFSNFTKTGGGNWSQVILELGILKRVAELQCHESPDVVIPAMRILGSIAAGDALQMQAVFAAGILLGLCHVLNNKSRALKKTAAMYVGNLIAGTEEQIQACIDCGIVDRLVHIVLHDHDQVKGEALRGLCNAAFGFTAEQHLTLLIKGAGSAIATVQAHEDERIAEAAKEAVNALSVVTTEEAEEFLVKTGRKLEELLPGATSLEGSAVALFKEGLHSANNTPIGPHRRLLHEVLTSIPLDDEEEAAVPPCSSAEARRKAINQRLAPIREDAWERRHHLAFARGAVRRGYRPWEEQEE
jgi:Armadillo/beta-catenin-like repeat